MSSPNSASPGVKPAWSSFFIFLVCLAGLLLVLFVRSFDSELTLFSNDGPLGAISSEKASMPGAFTGLWEDLNWVGYAGISAAPNITAVISSSFHPLGFSKFYTPICLMLLGISAWFFCRQLGFSSMTCILVGVAAAMNMNIFSNACWGLPTRALTLASAFAALAALHSAMVSRPLVKSALAGLAVGMGVMEGFDLGAIFSVYVAGAAFFIVLHQQKGTVGGKIGKGIGIVAIVAVFAVFIAAYTLHVLVSTQIQGVAGTKQDEQSKRDRWEYATQWSLPKVEALRVVVPGLFGYRMNDEFGMQYPACYWGTVGQQPGFAQTGGLARHSGSGEYAGVLVVLLAFWGVLQSLRGKQCPYTDWERKCVWFWGVLTFVSLILAFGKHTPFYQIIYALPYFSTIRNPIKFMHVFHFTLLILFAYGLQDLVRRYLEAPKEKVESLFTQINVWWSKGKGFEKTWTFGSLGVIAASMLAWLIYAAGKKDVADYLRKVGFPDEAQAASMAGFSLTEVGWSIFFLVLSVLFVTCILSGAFAGSKAKLAGFMLGMLLVVDLGRADSFWIVYENYKLKLASNPIIDVLRDKAYEHRVSSPQFPFPKEYAFYHEYYHMEWLQHHFQFYDVQSLDVAQMRSPPEDMISYEKALQPAPLRRWQLTNTRYLLSIVPYIDQLNQQLDPVQRRFKPHTLFTYYQRTNTEPVLTQTNTTGPFCLIEFTGALPRAKLYANWQTVTDQKALELLPNPAFDPLTTLLIADNLPAPKPEDALKENAGTVEITSYSSRRVKLAAKAEVPAILLLNDRLAADWNLWVDGKPEKILRANYLMRGVALTPGKHEIEFRYQPSLTFLKVSVAAIGIGVLLCGFLAVGRRRGAAAPEPMALATPAPGGEPPTAPAVAPVKNAKK